MTATPLERPTVLRACQLCMHSQVSGGRRMCAAPVVRLQGPARPVEQVRATDGGCGPNGVHLDMPAWH